jgi:hypothetical protein
MDWARKALYKLATGRAYWPPIDTVRLTLSSLYDEGKVHELEADHFGGCMLCIHLALLREEMPCFSLLVMERCVRAWTSRRSQVRIDQHLRGASNVPGRAAYP